MEWTRTAFLVPAQLAASMVAGGLVKVMFAGDISKANTTLGPGTSVAQGLFIEMILTAQLIFVILMLAAEKSKGTFLAPIGIGLALFVAELSGESTRYEEVENFLLSPWPSSFSRGLLDRRLPQPGPQFWLCGGLDRVPRLPLDLLARTVVRRRPGGQLLPPRQVGALRRGQPRTR